MSRNEIHRKYGEVSAVELGRKLVVDHHRAGERLARQVARRILSNLYWKRSQQVELRGVEILKELVGSIWLEQMIEKYMVDSNHVDLCAALVRAEFLRQYPTAQEMRMPGEAVFEGQKGKKLSALVAEILS